MLRQPVAAVGALGFAAECDLFAAAHAPLPNGHGYGFVSYVLFVYYLSVSDCGSKVDISTLLELCRACGLESMDILEIASREHV